MRPWYSIFMKKIFIIILLTVVVLFPKDYILAQSNQSQITQLLQLIAQLKQQLALLQTQSASTAISPSSASSTYVVSDVKKITYQEVYDGERNPLYRYEITLVNNSKLVVTVPKKSKSTEVAKKFKASGYGGDDTRQLLAKAKRVPGLKWETCELKSDRTTYRINESITLTWSSDAKYVAFNAYGSTGKAGYVDESFRESNGSITIKIGESGRHSINMNVYPWKERFASGACTVSFEVTGGEGDESDDNESTSQRPSDPSLDYFVVEPSATVTTGDRVTLRYSVDGSSQCGIFAESGAKQTTILAKAMNRSLRISEVALPSWVMPGSTFDFVLRCDSQSNVYYNNQIDALEESIRITVLQ